MGLKIWLPLNGNIENQGLADVTITNNGATVDNNGKIGKCYSFNGGTITAPAPKITNKITVAAWIKAPDNNSGWRRVCGMQSAAISWQSASALLMLNGTNLYFSISNGSTCTSGGCVFNIGDSSNWFHACGTYDGTTARLYVNGILKKECAIATTIENTPIWLGGTSAGERFTGKLNDFRLYDECLSADQIKEISRGMVLHYKMCQPERAINLIIGGNKLSAGGSGDGSITASNGVLHITSSGSYNSFYCDNNKASGTNLVNNLSVGDKFTVSFDFKSITSNSNPGLFINEGNSYIRMSGFDSSNKNKWQRVYCIRIWAAPGTRYGNLAFHINNIVGEAYIRNIKIEKGENPNPQWSPAPSDNPNWGTIEYDGSGFKNHGIVSGNVTLSADSPRYTGSYKFGTNNYITTTSTGNYIKSATFWAKDAGSVPIDGLVFRDQNSGLAFGIQSGNLITGAVGGPVGSSSAAVSVSDAKYTANTWHFFACVNDNGTHRLYMDGIQISTGTGTGKWSQGSPTNSLNVGGRAGSSYWPGYISDFKMYVTVLSAIDVQELYKLGRV